MDMHKVERKFQVFISSIYNGFKNERDAAYRAILQNKNIPVGMEYFPNGPHQMRYIKELIDDCDIFIIIIGNRYGTITQSGNSFIEDEFDYALSNKKRPIVFVSKTVLKNYDSKSLDPKFSEFIDKVMSNGGNTLNYSNLYMLEGQIDRALRERTVELEKTNQGWVKEVDYQVMRTNHLRNRKELKSIIDPLLSAVQNEVLTISNTDNSSSRGIVDSLYTSFCDTISANSDPIFIEIGYWLTDIYERTNSFEKSLNVAEYLFNVIDANNDWDSSSIRKMIGCSYSIAIAKENDNGIKRDHLYRVKSIFERLNVIINQKKDDFTNNELLVLEIYWNSDYAALLMNFYDLNKKTGTQNIDDYLADALYNHRRALSLRKQLLTNLASSSEAERKEVQIGIAQSLSNIGGIYYRLGDTDQAINYQTLALANFKELGMKTRALTTMGYIIGIYINKWSRLTPAEIDASEFQLCCDYAANIGHEYYLDKERNKAKELFEKSSKLCEISLTRNDLQDVYQGSINNTEFHIDWFND